MALASRSKRARRSGILQLRGQNLDRDCPVETGVPRAVDLAHAARAKGAHDLVGAETSA